MGDLPDLVFGGEVEGDGVGERVVVFGELVVVLEVLVVVVQHLWKRRLQFKEQAMDHCDDLVVTGQQRTVDSILAHPVAPSLNPSIPNVFFRVNFIVAEVN